MFFPIGDDNVKGGHKPLFSYSLIVLNIFVFIYELSLDSEAAQIFMFEFGTIPLEIFDGQDLFTMLSSMFLHGGWMHLIGNMLFLWVFADNIEAVIGSFNFIFFYLLGGFCATLIHAFVNPISEIPVVGASGAISAVMGAYLIMFPASRIRVLILIFFTTAQVPAILFLGIWIAQQTVSGIGSLNVGLSPESNVAWWAHIGGFGFGIIVGLLARKSHGHRYRYVNEE